VTKISPIIIPGVIGAIFCAMDLSFHANIIWVGSNALMAARSHKIGDDTNATSYIIFGFFALLGVVQHIWNS
jgi:hypothetical protein